MAGEVSVIVQQLVEGPISCHAWSHDGKKLAICPNNEMIRIFSKNEAGWKLETTLLGHDQLVTAMDWSCDEKRGLYRLLTVSADRNGYVWSSPVSSVGSAVSSEWQQSLVLLRLRRAATCVQWSTDGEKIAVGGAEGIVSVGYYEAENDWWVCKHLKNIDGSAILSLNWHPSGRILAVGTLAGNCHLLTANILSSSSGKGTKSIDWLDSEEASNSFDQSVGRIELNCWIHSMSFDADGNLLAMAGHDGNVHISDLQNGQGIQKISSPSNMPLRKIKVLSKNTIVVTCFTSTTLLILANQSSNANASAWSWESFKTSTTSGQRSRSTASDTATSRAFGGALAKFKSLDQHGVPLAATNNNDSNNTFKKPAGSEEGLHTSQISDLCITKLDGQEGVSTCGHDGRLILWDLQGLCNRLKIKAM